MRDSGSALLFIAVAFNFVVQMFFLIVDEKERKLRYAMEKVGMYDFLYWSSWYLFDCFINLLVVLMLMLFGVIFQFELFTENSAGLTFFHFWLCANAFTAVGFLPSFSIIKGGNCNLDRLALFLCVLLVWPSSICSRIFQWQY